MTRSPNPFALVLPLLAACAACSASSNPSIAVTSYDRSCMSVADCVAVYEGPANCCGLSCVNTAISQRALAAYRSGVVSATKMACGGTTGTCHDGEALFPDSCTGRVACRAGQCVLDVPPTDGAAE